MPVDNINEEYKNNQDDWFDMRNVISGQKAIKKEETRYLPDFIPSDKERYEAYVKRAVFVRYTGRTISALNGAIYRKDPSIRLPSSLEYMKDNADGAGQNLTQISKELTSECLSVARVGLLLDRPQRQEGSTLEDDRKSNLKSNFSIYKAESVVNWSTVIVGGATILSLVVLKEVVKIMGEDFQTESGVQYRVLGLDAYGKYYQQVYTETENEKGEKEYTPEPAIYPKDAAGNSWGHIPFYFTGSETNTVSIDPPPLLGMADVNIAHYRNSADYEEGVYMMGQPSLFVDPGKMSPDSFKENNPNGITIGSRRGNVLGESGKAYLLNMPSNTAAKEAMDQKESQMISIGAKIVKDAMQNQTAEEARINASAEHSVLNTIVGNVEDTINKGLKDATIFEGGNPEEVDYSINREYFPEDLTAQDITAMIMLRDNGDIAQSDIRELLRRAGKINPDRTDEDIENDIETQGF